MQPPPAGEGRTKRGLAAAVKAVAGVLGNTAAICRQCYIHPAVIDHENKWMQEISRRDPNAIAIVEAALILESGTASRFDHLIVVTCQPEQRVQRFARRLGISEDASRAEVARRMAAQIPDEEKIKAADFVIDNSGSLAATEQQVHRVFAALRSAL